MSSLKSLSARKIKRKVLKNVRNVLASPFQLQRPRVPLEDLEHLSSTLKECLPLSRVEKPKVPWSILKNVGKDERKNFINDLVCNESKTKEKALKQALYNRNFLLLGINSVLRGMDNGNVAFCLVEEDVKPEVLIKHVLISAKDMGIPVLLFPNLKEITQFALGFSCAALGFKNAVLDDKSNGYYQICIDLKKSADTLKKKEGIKKCQRLSETWFIEESPVAKDDNNSKIIKKDEDFYLYRTSNGISRFGSLHFPNDNEEKEYIPLEIGVNYEVGDQKLISSENITNSKSETTLQDEFINVKLKDNVPVFIPPKIQRIQSNCNKFKKSKK